MVIAAVVGLCWAAFLINPLTVGRNRYFMESRQSVTPFSTVTSIFRTPYLNVVKVMLLTSLKNCTGFPFDHPRHLLVLLLHAGWLSDG